MRSTMELDMSWALGTEVWEKEVLVLVEILPVMTKHKNNSDVFQTYTCAHLCVCMWHPKCTPERGTCLQAPAAVWERIPSFSTRVQLPNYYASTRLLYGNTQPVTTAHSSIQTLLG